MSCGKIINIHPIFFSDFYSPLDETLPYLNKNSSLMFKTVSPFGQYQRYLQIPKFEEKKQSSLEIIICGNGFGYLKTEHEVNKGDNWTQSINSLREVADKEREKLKSTIKISRFKEFLAEFGIHNNLQLSEVFSHNFILRKNAKSIAKSMGSGSTAINNIENIEFFHCNATANIFQINDDNYEYYVQQCANLTVFSATIYNIQEIALEESMKIIKNNFNARNEKYITKLNRTVSYFNQHLVNMKVVDFVDNVLVERTIGRIASEWDWKDVLSSSERAVDHFSQQVKKVENENKRRSDKKENSILIGFTLLSIISTAAVIIQLYDLNNNFEPHYRIATVITAFIFAVLLAIRYLRR